MKNLLLLLTVVFLTSCRTPCEISTRRIERIEKKCPNALTETITLVDTVIAPASIIHDTVFTLNVLDTIRIETDKQMIKIRRVYDKFYIDTAMCKTDTIIIIREVTVEKIIIQERQGVIDKIQAKIGKTVMWIGAILLGLLLVVVLFKFAKRFLGIKT